MTAAWIESWDRASIVWAGSLGRACWQGGTALVVVWLLCQAFATMSPTLRAWLWRLAYLKLVLTLLLPPILVPVLPARAIAPIHLSAPATDSVSGSVSGDVVPNAGPVSLPDTSASTPSPQSPPSGLAFRLSWTFWLSLCWGVGVVWCLVRVAGEWIAAGWLRGLSEPVEDEALTASCLELSERLGLRNPPQLMVSEGAGSPVLLGGSHPAIILPLALLAECSQPELELVIAHELAHHTRRDLLWGWAPALGHALFFFFPLEWLAAHEYRLAQEMACDELAIRTSRVHVGDYGEALLKVAARHRPNLQSRLVTVGIVESSQILKRRLLAMKEMGSFPVRPGMAVTAVVSLGLLGCVPWQLAPRALAEGASVFNSPAESPRTASAGQPDSSYRAEPNAVVTPGDNKALRYHPKAGESYVYAVKIETTESDYTETMSGNATYTWRTADDNGMILTCTGGLIPIRRATPGTVPPGNPFLRLHAFGFGGPGFPRPFAGPNEIKIDGQGHLLSTHGETPLPRALGDLSQLIVETLPSNGTKWEVQNGCVVVLHEARPLNPTPTLPFSRGGSIQEPPPLEGGGWGRSPFSRTEQRNLPASETLSYTLGAANGDLVKIDKHYALQTNERSFGAPTLQLTGNGSVGFDRKLGMPRTMELKLTLVEQPDRTTTTRVPVTVTYRLLEGDEREKALHPPAPVQPERKPIVETELPSTLTDLQSSDGFKVIAAANKLAEAKPAGDRLAVENALIGALEHKDGFARQSVVKALGTWGSSASVPALIKRLDDESFAVRWAVFEVLGARKDVRAAQPLAKWLEKDRGFASNALRKMGAMAAPAVAQQLKTGDWGMHLDVCHLLKEIGTATEIPALQALTHDENKLVADAAADAIKAIQQRGEKGNR